MFETFFFTVILRGYVTLNNPEPPQRLDEAVVTACTLQTNVNPFIQAELSDPYNELRFLDCVFHQLKHY
jgi:hypothetical protein